MEEPSSPDQGFRFGIPSDGTSDTDDSDVEMEEVPEDPSPKEHDADKAIDLMRFVFKEGLAFLDNGSGRCLTERMLVDMGGFMVNKMLEQPAVAQRNAPCRMRMFKSSTFETEMSHAFAKEARKGIAEELQGDFFGYLLMCVPRLTLGNTTWFFSHAMSTARERLWRGFLGLCRILISLVHLLKKQCIRCSRKLG